MNNIKKIINDIKNNNYNPSDDPINSYVLMRWLYGTNDPDQIILINEFMNTLMPKFYNHQRLLHKLATVSITSNSYKWLPPLKNIKIDGEKIDIIKKYYNCSAREASEYILLLTDDEISSMRDELGIDKVSKKEKNK